MKRTSQESARTDERAAQVGTGPTPALRASLAWLLAPAALVALLALPGLCAAPAGSAALAAGSVGLADSLRLIAAFLLLLILPGRLLDVLVFAPRPDRSGPPAAEAAGGARSDGLETIVRAFVLSLAMGSALGLAVWFLGGGALDAIPAPGAPRPHVLGRLSAIAWADAALLLAGGLILLVRAWRIRTPGTSADSEARRAPAAPSLHGVAVPGLPGRVSWSGLTLGALLVLGAAAGLRSGGQLGFNTDSPDHVSCVREMIERDRVLPRTTFHVDGDGAAVDSRKGFYHALLASVAQTAGVDPLDAWRFLPVLLVPLALLAFHAFARSLLGAGFAAVFAVFLMLVNEGEGGGLLMRLGYGSQMGMVLAWAVLALVLQSILGGDARLDRRRLGLIAAASFAAVATHLFAFVQVLFSLGVFLLALLIARGRRHTLFARAAVGSAAVLAGCLAPLAWRLIFTFAPLNPIHTHHQGILYLSDRLFVALPELWWRFLGWLGFAGIALSPALWKPARTDAAALYCAAAAAAPLLVVANPLLMPLIEPALGYLVDRLMLVVPYAVVLAWLGRRVLQPSPAPARRPALASAGALAFALLLAVTLGPQVATFARSHAPRAVAAREERSIAAWRDLFAALEKTTEPDATILSDPATDYAIPAATSRFAACVLHQHGNPADSLGPARLAACRDVLSPFIASSAKARLCRRFGVDYVLLAQTFARDRDLYTTVAGPEISRRQRAALERDSLLFARVWDGGSRGALYRVRVENLAAVEQQSRPAGAGSPLGGEEQSRPVAEGGPPGAAEQSPRIAPGDLLAALPAGARSIGAPGRAGMSLAGAEIASARVARGDSLDVLCYWRREGPLPELPVIVQVLLQTPFPRGPLAAIGFDNLDRLWQQRRRGELYSARQAHMVVDGQFGLEHWPAGSLVADRVRVPVPENAAPGAYTLKIAWAEEPFIPNPSLRGILCDEDRFGGIPVGVVDVDASDRGGR